MGRLVGRRIGAALFVAAVAVCVLWLGWFLSHKGLDWAAKAGEVASAAIAAIGFLVTPFGKIADWLRGPRPPTLEEIARARNALHSALNAAWREEGAGIYLDFPMQVRFARCQGSVAQSPPPDGALPGQGLAGDFGNIVDAFTRDPPFRRIVLGAPGAGKTVLVTELQRRLVAAPGPRDPLPVIVPAAAWRPDRHSILAWLAHRLSADYAFLTVGQARALVASGNVLPILDGLDEMPSALRPDAIARMNEYGVYRPLVVTSRAGEYLDAVHVCGTEPRGVATVSVLPMSPADIRAYLAPAGDSHWAGLLSQIDADPKGVLAQVLGNPLMLWLTRVVFEHGNPAELSSLGSQASIEDRLLGGFVPAVYTSDVWRATFGQFRCSVTQAKRWLGHLAWNKYKSYQANRPERKDDDQGASALAWWEFGSVAGRWRALGMLLRAAVLLGVAVRLTVWVLARQGNWRHGAYSGPLNIRALLQGGPFGRLIWPTMHTLLLALPKGAVHQTQLVITGFFRFTGEIFSSPLWLALAAVVFTASIAILQSSATQVSPRRLQIRPLAVLRRALASCAWIFGLAILLSWWVTAAHGHNSTSAFFGARSTWESLGLVALPGLGGVPWSFARRSDTSGNLSPPESLRLDRQADIVVTVSRRWATAMAAWLFVGPTIATAYALYAITATLVAVLMGGNGGFASRQYIDARGLLAVQGRLPWRTMAFLADANRRGILRQVGAVYQFRHIRLLEQVDEWRSTPRPARLHERMSRLGHELRTIFRGLEFGPGGLVRIRHLRQREEERQKTRREMAARYWRVARTTADELPSDYSLDELVLELLPANNELGAPSLRDLLDAYRAMADTDPGTYSSRLAWALMKSSQAFPQDEALQILQEAAEVYRALAESDAVSFLSDFAAAIQSLAKQLRQLGRVDEAQHVTRSLVDLCGQVAATDPTTAQPILAESLAHLADLLWDSQPADSLAARKEAVAVYRELNNSDPAKFPSGLIAALDALASSFKALDEQDEEMSAIRAALHAYRTHGEPFIVIPPTVFRLALRLWKLGSQQEVLELQNPYLLPYRSTAVRGIARLRLAGTWPIRSMTRRWEMRDARRRRRRARLWLGVVWLTRRIAGSVAASSQQRLAAALEHLSDNLDTLHFRRLINMEAGALAAAAAVIQAQHDAVEVYRELYSEHPDFEHGTALEAALDTLALRLQAAGKTDEARTAANEASKIWERHWRAKPVTIRTAPSSQLDATPKADLDHDM